MWSATHPKKSKHQNELRGSRVHRQDIEFLHLAQAQRVQSTCMVLSKVSVVGTSRTVWVSSPNMGNQSPFGNAVNPFRTPVCILAEQVEHRETFGFAWG